MTAVTFSPTNKHAQITLSNGNLTATSSTAGSYYPVASSATVASGKTYVEFTITSESSGHASWVGVAKEGYDASVASYPGSDGYTWGYEGTGTKWVAGDLNAAYGATWTTGDVISVLLDVDAGTLSFWKNGVDQGVSHNTGITTHTFTFVAFNSGVTSGAVITANFGATAFAHTPPAGYAGLDAPAPTPGHGSGTLPAITGYGARVAAGAGVLPHIGGSGGYNGIGAGTLPAIHGAGTGGHNGGAGTLAALTATGTGHQAHYGVGVLGAITAAGTGHDSSINTVAATVPAITLSSTGIAGEVITFAGTIPAITLECGTKDARLTVPAPTLSATLLSGSIITVEARVAAPILVATLDNPAIITIASTVPAIRLSASLATGNLATAILTLRPPSISAQIFTGNVATVAATVAAPIMEAAGYPAYTITFAGTVPAPRLNATLSAVIVSSFRTWVANLRKGALTEYSNFEFDSYAVFNGVVLGCGSSGIVELGTQSLDNTTAISSTVTSGKDNFGSSVIKRLPRVYLSHTASGDARFKLITTEGGSRTYALDWNRVTGIQQRRIPVGKGPKSVRWQWEYTNTDGSDFDIEAVLAYPQALRRRVQ